MQQPANTAPDYRRRRLIGIAVPLAIIATVTLLAVSGSGPFATDEPDDPIGDAVVRFIKAGSARDFETTCELLANEALDPYKKIADRLGTEPRAACPQLLAARSGTTEPQDPPAIEVLDVRTSGNRAAVDIELKREGSPVNPQTVDLVFEEGTWRIVISQ